MSDAVTRAPEAARSAAVMPPLGARRLAMGGAASLLFNVLKAVIQFLTLPLMAALLKPADFGLYALALPIVIFASTLADGGLGASLARESESETDVWSTAFWLLLLLGLAAMGAVCLAGFAVGALTGIRGVSSLAMLMSPGLLFWTLGITPGARLERQGRILAGASGDLLAAALGFVVGVALAYDGFGAVSLAAQFLTTSVTRAAWLQAASFRLPRAVFKVGLLRAHFHVSGQALSGRIIDLTERLLGNALLARTLGIAALGHYTLATQACRFSTEVVGNTTWQMLYIQAIRRDDSQTERLYRQLIRLYCVVVLPASLVAAAAAPELVREFFPPRWQAASGLIALLLPFYALSIAGGQISPLLLAEGRYSAALIAAGLGGAVRLAVFAGGGMLGLTGVAVAVAATLVLSLIVLLARGQKVVRFPAAGIFTRELIPAVATGMMGAFAFTMALRLAGDGPVGLCAGLLAAFCCVACLLLVSGRRKLQDDWESARKLVVPKRNETTQSA